MFVFAWYSINATVKKLVFCLSAALKKRSTKMNTSPPKVDGTRTQLSDCLHFRSSGRGNRNQNEKDIFFLSKLRAAWISFTIAYSVFKWEFTTS